MKLKLPPRKVRQSVIYTLGQAFDKEDVGEFNKAVSRFLVWYDARCPKVRFVSRQSLNGVLGRTSPDGRVINLMSPLTWKGGKVYNTCELWVATVIHELFHSIALNHTERHALQAEDSFCRGIIQVPVTKRNLKLEKSKVKKGA